MKILLQRLPNGEFAPQRIVLGANGPGRAVRTSPSVRKEKPPHQERSFIDVLLGEKGRAIVARINPRFRQPRLQVIKVQGDKR